METLKSPKSTSSSKLNNDLLQDIYNDKDIMSFAEPPAPIQLQHSESIIAKPWTIYHIDVNGTKFHVSSKIFSRLEPYLTLDGVSKVNSLTGTTEYFIWRHVGSFTAILDYFQSGELHMPLDVCPKLFKKELQYWGVDWRAINPCCLRRYISFHDNEETLNEFDNKLNANTNAFNGKVGHSKWMNLRRRGWALVDDHRSSVWAKVFLAMATLFVVLSIFVLAASTHPRFTRDLTTDEWEEYMTNDELYYYWDELFPDKPRPDRMKPGTSSEEDLPPMTTEPDPTTDTSTKSSLGHGIGKRSLNDEIAKEKVLLYSPGATRMRKNDQHFEKNAGARQKKVITHLKNTDINSALASLQKLLFNRVRPDNEVEIDSQEHSLAKEPLDLVTEEWDEDTPGYDTNGLETDSWQIDKDNLLAFSRKRRSAGTNNSAEYIDSREELLNKTGKGDMCYTLSGFEMLWLLENFGVEEETVATTTLPTNVFTVQSWLRFLELICIAYFTFEILIRFVFAPNRCRFLLSFHTLMDLLSLATMYLVIFIHMYDPKAKYTTSYVDLINCMQLVRVFRFFRLVKDVIGFRVLIFSIRSSYKELLLLVLYIVMAVTVFSSLVYFCERENMKSIPNAAWWVIVTMTTVGYGDMVPRTALGKCVGCACALSGVLLIAVTVPVFVNNFLLFYEHSKLSKLDDVGNDDTSNSDVFVTRESSYDETTLDSYNSDSICTKHGRNDKSGCFIKRAFSESSQSIKSNEGFVKSRKSTPSARSKVSDVSVSKISPFVSKA